MEVEQENFLEFPLLPSTNSSKVESSMDHEPKGAIGDAVLNISLDSSTQANYHRKINARRLLHCLRKSLQFGSKRGSPKTSRVPKRKIPQPLHRYRHRLSLNFKRKGLRRILKLAMLGNLKELVVASRDRLARFVTELITWVITRGGGRQQSV